MLGRRCNSSQPWRGPEATHVDSLGDVSLANDSLASINTSDMDWGISSQSLEASQVSSTKDDGGEESGNRVRIEDEDNVRPRYSLSHLMNDLTTDWTLARRGMSEPMLDVED